MKAQTSSSFERDFPPDFFSRVLSRFSIELQLATSTTFDRFTSLVLFVFYRKIDPSIQKSKVTLGRRGGDGRKPGRLLALQQ